MPLTAPDGVDVPVLPAVVVVELCAVSPLVGALRELLLSIKVSQTDRLNPPSWLEELTGLTG